MSSVVNLLASVKDDLAQKQELERALCELAAVSPEDRAALLADPKAFLSERCGQALPDNLKVVVHEDTSEELHLTIPSLPSASEELTDDQLAGVAGGFGFAFAIKKIAIVLLTTYATEKVVDMTKKNMGETAGQVAEIASDLV
jgi:hypothetical protein